MPKIEEKRWEKEFEPKILEEWEQLQLYAFNKNSKKEIYSIDTPPPYINAPIHIGHATTYSLMDFFARFQRMNNKEVLFPLGLDRNGLPIEIAAEKKYKVNLTEVTREEAIAHCKRILEETTTESTESFRKLGISFNNQKEGTEPGDAYLTDSADYRALTQQTFVQLWEQNLIYEDDYPSNWDTSLKTTLADSEIEYAELPSHFNDIIFKVKETGEELIISTTRPELLCTCSMVIFNPEDERYKHLEGKTVITPLYNKEVTIKAHPSADKDKGTGLVMMCAFGDITDIQFFHEHNLHTEIAIEQDGRMNAHAGFLEGYIVHDARKKIIEMLKEKQLLVKSVELTHRTPISERSKTPVEFIAIKEFYLKQMHCKEKLKEIAQELNVYQPASRQILLDWINTISKDWPISRRRYYGTEIPLWYAEEGKIALPSSLSYVQPWKQQPPATASVYDTERKKIGTVADFPNSVWKGEQRIFDTWFDSSISPLYILQWGKDKSLFERAKQCTLRPQGREIIRTWLYYTLLRGYLLTGKTIFRDVWINYYVVAEDGKKMSKSLGNGIEPKTVIEKYGAEPFRLWVAIEGNIAAGDMRCSLERIEGAGKTLIKLWNVVRFVSIFEPSDEVALTPVDQWIRNEINNLVTYTKKHYEQYDFHKPAQQLKHFLWETFASHYVELAKARAYNSENTVSKEEQQAAINTLHYCLKKLLILFNPIIPFITYKLYNQLYDENIVTNNFPIAETITESAFTTKELEAINSEIWKQKSQQGISMKSEINSATLPEKFKIIGEDLRILHHIKACDYHDKEYVTLSF